MDDKEMVERAIEWEREQHGAWADEATIKHIVADELKSDPNHYYEMLDMDEPEHGERGRGGKGLDVTIVLGKGRKPEPDEFPDEEEDEDYSDPFPKEKWGK